jgi:hypothetical protein
VLIFLEYLTSEGVRFVDFVYSFVLVKTSTGVRGGGDGIGWGDVGQKGGGFAIIAAGVVEKFDRRTLND